MHLRGESLVHCPSPSRPARDLRDEARWHATLAKTHKRIASNMAPANHEPRAVILEDSAYHWGLSLLFWRAWRVARNGGDWRACFPKLVAISNNSHCACAGCLALEERFGNEKV